jgi:hypothetical protein
MSDARLRHLERAAQGDPEAEARLLREQVRSGGFPARRLELLAEAGVPVARLALGRPTPSAPSDEPADLQAFRRRLAAAIVWCTERLDEGEAADATLLRDLPQPEISIYGQPLTQRQEALDELGQRREDTLEASGGWIPGASATSLAGGRLLLHDVEWVPSNGVAADASGHLLGLDDHPPAGTWVHYAVDGLRPGSWRTFRSYLVAWIPAICVSRVEAGVAAHVSKSLVWADDHDEGVFTGRLRDAGLLLQRAP